MKRIDYESGLIFASATVPGAILGTLNTSIVPRRLFDIIFGVLLVVAAGFLSLRPHLAEDARRVYCLDHQQMRSHLEEADGATFNYCVYPRLGVLLSLFIGYASSFLASAALSSLFRHPGSYTGRALSV